MQAVAYKLSVNIVYFETFGTYYEIRIEGFISMLFSGHNWSQCKSYNFVDELLHYNYVLNVNSQKHDSSITSK